LPSIVTPLLKEITFKNNGDTHKNNGGTHKNNGVTQDSGKSTILILDKIVSILVTKPHGAIFE
jgi:hypothetical protein